MALGDYLLQNLQTNTLEFDIHLHGGNAVPGPGNLAVHIAVGILQTLDVG
ncbi:hypothetical protein ES703_42573 [subsurface metagenome]